MEADERSGLAAGHVLSEGPPAWVELFELDGGDDQTGIVHIGFSVSALIQLMRLIRQEYFYVIGNFRGDQTDMRTTLDEQATLAQGNLASADHQTSLALDINKNRQIIHRDVTTSISLIDDTFTGHITA